MVQPGSTPACMQREQKGHRRSSDHPEHLGNPTSGQGGFLALAKRCFGEQMPHKHTPGCKVHVQGGSDPATRGRFIASICDDRFYKEILFR